MPFTPYHFGPSGFIGLVFRKWLDLPVLVLANVIVDIEVLIVELFGLGYPIHRYCHTFLIGVVVGLLWGIAAYPLRHFFSRLMKIFCLRYETSLPKMLISGVLGVWLHVLIDGIYHFDVYIFWPSRTIWLWRTIHRYTTDGQIKKICLLFFLAAVVPYLFAIRSFLRENKIQSINGRK